MQAQTATSQPKPVGQEGPRDRPEVDGDDDNDPFSFLSGKNIMLKRASHVSDAEDSDGDGSD